MLASHNPERDTSIPARGEGRPVGSKGEAAEAEERARGLRQHEGPLLVDDVPEDHFAPGEGPDAGESFLACFARAWELAASAATVGVTFLGISFARMGVFKTVGASSAIGIGVAFLAAVTLLPAILVLIGPRGWVKPRRELTAQFWRRSGIRIVARWAFRSAN